MTENNDELIYSMKKQENFMKEILSELDNNDTKVEELKSIMYSMQTMMRQMSLVMNNMAEEISMLKGMNNSNNMVNDENRLDTSRMFRN